jgi:hypothetical protein
MKNENKSSVLNAFIAIALSSSLISACNKTGGSAASASSPQEEAPAVVAAPSPAPAPEPELSEYAALEVNLKDTVTGIVSQTVACIREGEAASDLVAVPYEKTGWLRKLHVLPIQYKDYYFAYQLAMKDGVVTGKIWEQVDKIEWQDGKRADLPTEADLARVNEALEGKAFSIVPSKGYSLKPRMIGQSLEFNPVFHAHAPQGLCEPSKTAR